jgi:hypothetical protein
MNIDSMRKVQAALDAVNEYDIKNMLPLPLWRQVMEARAIMCGAVAAAEWLERQQQKETA